MRYLKTIFNQTVGEFLLNRDLKFHTTPERAPEQLDDELELETGCRMGNINTCKNPDCKHNNPLVVAQRRTYILEELNEILEDRVKHLLSKVDELACANLKLNTELDINLSAIEILREFQVLDLNHINAFKKEIFHLKIDLQIMKAASKTNLDRAIRAEEIIHKYYE